MKHFWRLSINCENFKHLNSARSIQHIVHDLFCPVVPVLFLSDGKAGQLGPGILGAIWQL
jgi:hypothetical protein